MICGGQVVLDRYRGPGKHTGWRCVETPRFRVEQCLRPVQRRIQRRSGGELATGLAGQGDGAHSSLMPPSFGTT